MRYGARTLFAISGIELILGILFAAFQFVQMTGQAANAMGGPFSMSNALYVILSSNLMAAVTRPILPFFGAVFIGHLEHWAKERGKL